MTTGQRERGKSLDQTRSAGKPRWPATGLAPHLPVLLCALLALPASSARGALSLAVERLAGPDLEAGSLRLDLTDDGSGVLQAGSVQVLGQRIDDVRVHCPRLRRAGDTLDCPRLHVPLLATEPLRLSLDPARQRLTASLGSGGGHEGWQLDFHWQSEPRASLTVRDGNLTRLRPLLVTLLPGSMASAASRLDGRLSGRLHWPGQGQPASVRLDVHRLAFSDPAGARAGEELSGTLQASLSPASPRLWTTRARFTSGTVLWPPLLFTAPVDAVFSGDLDGEGAASIDFSSGRLELGWWRDRDGLSLATEGLDLAEVAGLLEPWLLETPLADGTLSGRLRGRLTLSDEGPEGRLAITDGGIQGPGLALSGIDALLPLGSAQWQQGSLHVARISLGDLDLGPVSTPLRLRRGEVAIDRVCVPVLDGRLRVSDLLLETSVPRVRAEVAIEPVSLRRLTAALGWPELHGSLSAVLPRLRMDAGGMRVEGAALLRVFDGTAVLRNMRLAFGPLLRFSADVQARRLDLGTLTGAVDFGNITGRADMEISGLELAGGQPVAFDLRLASNPGDEPRRISRQAVSDLGALGGGGGLEGLLLGLFDSFGYRRLGARARLADGVLHIDGIEDRGDAYLLVEGSGIPAMTVLGYNRRVDWASFLSRITRVTGSPDQPEPPEAATP